jgi:hypothetical protein
MQRNPRRRTRKNEMKRIEISKNMRKVIYW